MNLTLLNRLSWTSKTFLLLFLDRELLLTWKPSKKQKIFWMQETSLLLVFVRLLTLVLFFAFRLFASFNVFSIRIPLGFFVLTKLYQRRKELYEVFNCYLVKTVKSKKLIFLPSFDESAIKTIRACNHAQLFTKHS